MPIESRLAAESIISTNDNHDRSRALYDLENAHFCIDARYKVDKVLGKGSYGTVCSAVDTKSTNKVAIKKVSNIFDKEVLLKRAVRELKLMVHFRGHRNIVNLKDLDIIYDKPYDGLYCYQDLVENDLTHVIFSGIQFSEFHILSFIYQILCGLKYIHSADVIHRDLKPGNILVTNKGQLQICDFGLARGINSKYTGFNSPPITNYVATRWYRAPELILSKSEYTKAVDLWAVGCILGELYGRKPMFMGNNQLHQITEISKILGNPTLEVIRKYNWKLYSPGAAALAGGKDAEVTKKSQYSINTVAPRLQYPGIALLKLYPYACEKALGMLQSLLYWDPDSRLNVEQALSHSFLAEIRSPENEPVHPTAFDFSFEEDKNHYLRILQQDVERFREEKRTYSLRRPESSNSEGKRNLSHSHNHNHNFSTMPHNKASDTTINEPHKHHHLVVRTFQA